MNRLAAADPSADDRSLNTISSWTFVKKKSWGSCDQVHQYFFALQSDPAFFMMRASLAGGSPIHYSQVRPLRLRSRRDAADLLPGTIMLRTRVERKPCRA